MSRNRLPSAWDDPRGGPNMIYEAAAIDKIDPLFDLFSAGMTMKKEEYKWSYTY